MLKIYHKRTKAGNTICITGYILTSGYSKHLRVQCSFHRQRAWAQNASFVSVVYRLAVGGDDVAAVGDNVRGHCGVGALAA